MENNTNVRLQNAINKYGLENLTFVVVEVFKVDPEVSMKTNRASLLYLEQKYLKWVFTLPANLCTTLILLELLRHLLLTGLTHTPETRAQMSDSKSGDNNPMYGRTGALNPMYGKVPTNAMTINVYSIDNVLVRSFTSCVTLSQLLKG